MAQTTQAFIANMLEMRKQNAAAAQFRAQMQQAQYDRMSSAIASAGKGLGQVFGGGMSAQDRLANSLMQQQYTIPGAARAQAVNPAMQGPADAIAKSMYMGGMDEFNMRQKMEDQTAQRAVQGSLIDSRTARNEASLAQIELAGGNLAARQREIDLRAEAMEQAEQARIAKAAMEATKLANKQYMETYNNATAYNKRMASHLKQISTAKDPTQWQAGVDAMSAEYQAGIKTGLKVAEPTVRPFVDELQKDEIMRQEQRLKANITGVTTDAWPDALQGGMVPWGRASREQQAMKGLEALRSQPGYAESQPGYAPPPQPEGIFATVPPPTDLNTPSPSAPSQAVGGTASGGSAPQPISEEEAFKMTGVRRAPGKRFDSGPGTQVYVVK